MLLCDNEILDAMKKKEIEMENFSKEYLYPASYDMRLGKTAIISKTIKLEELKKKVKEGEEVQETDIEKLGRITIPPGAFVLLTTLEKIKLSKRYAGHIGMRSYYTRKGLCLLSGIQIDPGFEGILVLGAVNLSPRSIIIEYAEPICTIEMHKLNKEASEAYHSKSMEAQRKGLIPTPDKDYLRTIETMSISDLTNALITLSNNVGNLSTLMKLFWIPLIIVLIAVVVSIIL